MRVHINRPTEDYPLIGERDVLVIHDERMLAHQPDAQAPFQPGKLDSRIQTMLGGLFDGATTKWSYPEHPGRLLAITDLLTLEPVPGVRYETASAATQEQLGRVHATSYLENIYALRGKQTWLDVDTTAVSSGSIDAAEVAAGSAIAAVDAVVTGRAGKRFRPVPPARPSCRIGQSAGVLPVQQRRRGSGTCAYRAGLRARSDH